MPEQHNRRSEIGNQVVTKLKLSEIPERFSEATDEGDEYSVFYYDFMLSNVFGYKWVNIRHEEGTFEVFEPTLKPEVYEHLHKYARGKSTSVYSEAEESSSPSMIKEESPIHLNFKMISQDTDNFSPSPLGRLNDKQMTISELPRDYKKVITGINSNKPLSLKHSLTSNGKLVILSFTYLYFVRDILKFYDSDL